MTHPGAPSANLLDVLVRRAQDNGPQLAYRFLADGESVRGMASLISQAGAVLLGVGVAIEKGFQQGGRTLRRKGVKLLSLSVVTSIQDGKIVLEGDR